MHQVLQRGIGDPQIPEIEEGRDAHQQQQRGQILARDGKRIERPAKQQAHRRHQRIGGRVLRPQPVSQHPLQNHRYRRGRAGDQARIEARLGQPHLELADHQRGEEVVEAKAQHRRKCGSDHQLPRRRQREQPRQHCADRRHVVAVRNRIMRAAPGFGHHEPGHDPQHHARQRGDEERLAPAPGLRDPAAAHEADQRAHRRRQHQHRYGGTALVRREVVRNHRLQAGQANRFAQPHAHARGEQLHPASRPAAQRGGSRPQDRADGDQRQAAHPFRRARHHQAHADIEDSEGHPHQRDLPVAQAEFGLDRFDQHIDHDPVDKAHRADHGEHDQRKPRRIAAPVHSVSLPLLTEE